MHRVLAVVVLAGGCAPTQFVGEFVGECPRGLLPGDLAISEVFADAPGPDLGQEWWEFYNATSAPIDLEGVVLRVNRELYTLGPAVLDAGEYFVVGDATDRASAPHLDVAYGSALGRGLPQSMAELAIGCGDTAIDRVFYEHISEGHARAFDGQRAPDAVANDDPLAWCDAGTEFYRSLAGKPRWGTPGTANDPCFSSAPTTCLDNGRPRALVPPIAGDVVINEFLADPVPPRATSSAAPDDPAQGPSQGQDEHAEWVELYVRNDVDLNGLGFSKDATQAPKSVLGAQRCLRAPADSYAVFARSLDPNLNGELASAAFTLELSLSNAPSTPAELHVSWGGAVLDSVRYARARPGKAWALDLANRHPEQNDDNGAFCLAQQRYGSPQSRNHGSPGAENPRCPPAAGHCITADNAVRPIRSPRPGDVAITEVLADPAAVDDPDGEWFELQVRRAFDLNALTFGRRPDREGSVVHPGCLQLQPGDIALFARRLDPARNGGLPEADWTFDFSLVNRSGGSLWVGSGTEILDEVSWSQTVSGAATQFSDGRRTCESTVYYGQGDAGTPGIANPPCPDARTSVSQ